MAKSKLIGLFWVDKGESTFCRFKLTGPWCI